MIDKERMENGEERNKISRRRFLVAGGKTILGAGMVVGGPVGFNYFRNIVHQKKQEIAERIPKPSDTELDNAWGKIIQHHKSMSECVGKRTPENCPPLQSPNINPAQKAQEVIDRNRAYTFTAFRETLLWDVAALASGIAALVGIPVTALGIFDVKMSRDRLKKLERKKNQPAPKK